MEPGVEEQRQTILRLIEQGQHSIAAEQGAAALQRYPDDPELTMLAGLACDQQGDIEKATSLLRRATVLDPTNPEVFHNLALCLYNQGNLAEAEIFAREALKLDPQHEQALLTLSRCRTSETEVGFRAEGVEVGASAESVRRGLDDPPKYVWGLGPNWTKVGYGIVFYCVFSFAFLVFHPLLDEAQHLRRDPGSIVAFFLYVTAALLSLFWMLFDIIDRRERFVWLLPMWVCGLAALPALPLALYLAVGRKIVPLN